MIALDAMGGDNAPKAVIEGALVAARGGHAIMLCGPQQLLQQHLTTLDADWQQHAIEVVDAPDGIAMDEDPVRAVKLKRNSSLVRAVSLVKSGMAHAVVSAGNSGALLAASMFLLGRKHGIERPAIAAFLPTMVGRTLCLDLGANTECKPHYLHQFARLGSAYLQDTLSVAMPRVGVLANGAESGKGSQLTKEASRLISQDSQLHFVGNIEPDALVTGEVDVLVTDGFTGNILLKTFEATASLYRLAIDSPAARVMNAQGGALLLGTQATVVVAHGCASSEAIAQAIFLASESSQRIRLQNTRRTNETGCTIAT